MLHRPNATLARAAAMRSQALAPHATAGFVLALALFAPRPAGAHDAPAGWSYPYACCSGYDCRQVPTRTISESPNGYVINRTGEVVSYSDTRVKDLPDGEYHWCSTGGAEDGHTICLFVPQHLY